MTNDEIFSKIQVVLEDALGADPEEITPEATLGPDLGAESIDYLDIVFRLEKEFGIKIDQAQMMPNDVLTNPEYVEDGRVTDKGIAELKAKMPHADLSAIEQSRNVDDFEQAFTVDTLTKFVASRI